jgi:predicted nucleotidyltransferase
MLHAHSSDSVTIISLDRNEVLSALRRVAVTIRSAHPEVTDIRLFGSIARGDETGISDADVLLVVRGEVEPDPISRIRRFYGYFDLPIGVDVIVYTEMEVTRKLASGDPFLTTIWAESESL